MGLIYSKITRSTKMASSPEIQKFIKEAVSQEKVVVFSKSYCPYCNMAKEASYLFYLHYKKNVFLLLLVVVKIIVTHSNRMLDHYLFR